MRVALFGATGTIGRATANALLDQRHEVICPVRQRAGFRGDLNTDRTRALLPGVELHFIDGSSAAWLLPDFFGQQRVDAVISCLASRTGRPADAWDVDYRLNADILKQAISADVKHFVLLSAICVQKPLLGFQQAKLAFENLLANSGMRHSIVRPTAFFKSLSGQLRRVQQGKPFLLFGDGRLTACKPISDYDLALFLVSCLSDANKHDRILPVGGPGAAMTPIEQAEYLFERLGKKPRYKCLPVVMMDVIVQALKFGGYILPTLADKAELAKIGRYYATESMLVWDTALQRYDAGATPSFGTQTLFDYYDQLISGEQQLELGDHAVF